MMGYKVINMQRVWRHFLNKLYKNPVKIALVISLGLMAACAFVIAIEQNISFTDATLRVLPLFMGELGNIEGTSGLAKLADTIGLFAGVGFMAIIGGRIVSWFVSFSLKGGRIVKNVKYKNHIIICGWNFQGENMVRQLLSPDIADKHDVVILANIPKRPNVVDSVDFIYGDPTKEDDLKKAGIMTADTAIVLTGMGQGAEQDMNPDAQAVLITLAIETLRPDVYTCVQLFNSEYKKHLERANVDEYICLDRLSGNLMVASALNHGLSRILGELLEFSSGSEFYKKEIPEEFVGLPFRKAADILHQAHITLFAIETKEEIPRCDENGNEIYDKQGQPLLDVKEKWIINPQENDYPGDYVLQPQDKMFFLAVEEPTHRDMMNIVRYLKTAS